jgi:hypothetical protein
VTPDNYLSVNGLVCYFFIFTVLPVSLLIYYYRDLIFGFRINGTIRNFKLNDDRITKFIDSAVEEIDILSGEACPIVFTDKTEEALRKAKKRGIKIKVILGPFILTRNNTKDQSIIPHLANEGILDLYILNKRERTHFIVDKRGRLNIEMPHEPNAEYRTAIDFERNQFEARRYRKHFKSLLMDSTAKKYIRNENNLLFLTEEELEKLKSWIHETTKNNINEYSQKEIEDMIGEIRQNSARQSS